MFGNGNDYDNATARTPGAGQTLVHQYLTAAGDTYWVQMQNGPTAVAGTTVTINETAPTSDRSNLAVCEILPTVAAQTWSISGTITPTAGGSGAVVNLSGPASTTTTADASGNYTFTGLPNGTYTVTPTNNWYTFSPANQSVTISAANASAINFTATPNPTSSISGTISGGASATVGLSGSSTATTGGTLCDSRCSCPLGM